MQSLTRNSALPFTSGEVIKNLSNYQLSEDEKDVLKNGLSFALPPFSIKKTDVFVTFEMVSKFMTQNLRNEKQSNELKTALSHLANSYVLNYRPSRNTLKKHGILKKLRGDQNIVIVKPDKGNGVVILNKADYNTSLMSIISDTNKFKLLEDDPTLKREGQLKRFLPKLKKNYKKDFFSTKEYDRIYPKGSVPARIYGLPKMHKTFVSVPPFRPVVSSIGTFNYNLSQYLGSLLTPFLPAEYTARDTFTFVDELKEVSFTNKYMVSYDVCSLFTNIPLKETIDLAVDLILNKHPNFSLKRTELRKLFEFATLCKNGLTRSLKYWNTLGGSYSGYPSCYPSLTWHISSGAHSERQG